MKERLVPLTVSVLAYVTVPDNFDEEGVIKLAENSVEVSSSDERVNLVVDWVIDAAKYGYERREK